MEENKSTFRKNLTVPNLLSLLRIIVIAPMIKFILAEDYIGAGAMLLISGISDALDGWIARKFNQVTQLGKMLDPIADKLTLIAVVVCVSILYPTLFVFVAILLLKEILMLLGGLVLIKNKIKTPAAKWYGKVATIIFYTSVITVVLLKAIWGIVNPVLNIVLFCLTTGAMLFSLVNYAILFFKLLKEKKAENTKNGD